MPFARNVDPYAGREWRAVTPSDGTVWGYYPSAGAAARDPRVTDGRAVVERYDWIVDEWEPAR